MASSYPRECGVIAFHIRSISGWQDVTGHFKVKESNKIYCNGCFSERRNSLGRKITVSEYRNIICIQFSIALKNDTSITDGNTDDKSQIQIDLLGQETPEDICIAPRLIFHSSGDLMEFSIMCHLTLSYIYLLNLLRGNTIWDKWDNCCQKVIL